MQVHLTSLLKRFQELPDNLPPHYYSSKWYRFYVTANYGYLYAAIIHVLFIFLFALMGINVLVI